MQFAGAVIQRAHPWLVCGFQDPPNSLMLGRSRSLHNWRQSKLKSRETRIDRPTDAVRPVSKDHCYLARGSGLRNLNGDRTHQTVRSLSILLIASIHIGDAERRLALRTDDNGSHGRCDVNLRARTADESHGVGTDTFYVGNNNGIPSNCACNQSIVGYHDRSAYISRRGLSEARS